MTVDPLRVLLIEDDPDLGPLLVQLLGDDFETSLIADGVLGLNKALSEQWSAIVIDRGLPGLDGISIVTALRRKGISTPVLILTALGTPADKVEGLDAGANDYLSKPFDASELKARIRAMTRDYPKPSNLVEIGNWTFNEETRSISSIYGQHVGLSAKEAELLAHLASNPARVHSRSELLAELFHAGDSPGVIDTYVHYLRRKIDKSVVRTVHGLGYQLGEAE